MTKEEKELRMKLTYVMATIKQWPKEWEVDPTHSRRGTLYTAFRVFLERETAALERALDRMSYIEVE